MAAPSLFERCGDAVTILEAIAEQALVSPKTITALFGSKRELLAEAINPEDASPRVRHLIEELRASEDVSRRLSLGAQIVEQRWEPERYETWLAQLLVQHLLAPASG